MCIKKNDFFKIDLALTVYFISLSVQLVIFLYVDSVGCLVTLKKKSFIL